MGSSQTSEGIYLCLDQLNSYQPIYPPSPPLGPFSQLLRTTEQQILSDHQAKLVKNKQQCFLVKTHTPFESLQDYEGCLVITSDGGTKLFEGVVKKGKRREYGQEFDSEGQLIYEGQFENDSYEGVGRTSNYRGQFLKGKRHGWGVYEDQKMRYEGMFEEGRFSGMGFLNVQQHQVRDFMQSSLFLNDPNIWLKYVGQWKQGRVWGSGKLVTKSQIYCGEFTRGQFNGEGKLIDIDGKVIEERFYFGITK